MMVEDRRKHLLSKLSCDAVDAMLFWNCKGGENLFWSAAALTASGAGFSPVVDGMKVSG